MSIVLSILAGVIGASIFRGLRPRLGVSRLLALSSGVAGGSLLWLVLTQDTPLRGDVGSVLLILSCGAAAGAATCAVAAVVLGRHKRERPGTKS